MTASQPTGPKISAVVCTHNGARTLPACLESLERQTLDAGLFEVIVVDDGSTDGTAAVAEQRDVRLIRLNPNAGLAGARNAGVGAARSPIVAFTDDDCEAAPDWLEQLLLALEDEHLDGVGGRVIPEATAPFVRAFLQDNNPLTPLPAELLESNSLLYRLRLYLKRVVGSGSAFHELYSVTGANMAFRRESLLDLGGFDEAFRFGSEEEDLCRRLHARPRGARLRYLPDAVVVHRFDDRIRDSLRRARAYGRGNARSALKHPDFRIIVYPVPVVTAAVGGAGLLVGRTRLVAAAALLPLIGYPDWLRHARRRRSTTPLAYPFLRFAQEVCAMGGEWEGIRAGYEPVPSVHLAGG